MNKGWKEKSTWNSTSGSKINAGWWEDVCMYVGVYLKKVLPNAVDWRCNGEGKELKKLKKRRWLLSCSKAEVKPGIFNQSRSSRRCESSELGLTYSSVAGIHI